ncbi:MAG: thioredoxin family protein [Candidatus Micrarchaeota archaeon]|nr:thioredoxin family protein [Candidatus Micrarchaeota archaeon]
MVGQQKADLREQVPFIIGLIVLLVLLVICTYYFIQVLGSSMGGAGAGAPVDIFSEGQSSGNTSTTTVAPRQNTIETCLSDAGINSTVFLYSPTCPHCQRMQPIIDQLIAEGHAITKVSVQDPKKLAAISSCVRIRSVVPQLICNRDGAILEGETTIDTVREFYAKCAP